MSMAPKSDTRPGGVTALSLFFFFGAAMSFIAFVSLLFPASFLEPMWLLNPQAREGFASIGVWAIVLMCVVSVACASAAVGLWRGARWGYWLALVLLAINLLGDIINVVLRTEPRAAVGIPIVIVILVYLMSRKVRRFYRRPPASILRPPDRQGRDNLTIVSAREQEGDLMSGRAWRDNERRCPIVSSSRNITGDAPHIKIR